MKKRIFHHAMPAMALAVTAAAALSLSACSEQAPAEPQATAAQPTAEPPAAGPAEAIQEQELTGGEIEQSAQNSVNTYIDWGDGTQLSYYGEGEGKKYEFATTTLEGDEADQTLFEGKKVTMVNVWGTYCGPCLIEMPDLGRIAADYSGDDFRLIGVVCDVLATDSAKIAAAQEIVDETGADYAHLAVSDSIIENILMDTPYVPTTLFIGEDGRLICAPVVGSKNYDAWAGIIDELLER